MFCYLPFPTAVTPCLGTAPWMSLRYLYITILLSDSAQNFRTLPPLKLTTHVQQSLASAPSHLNTLCSRHMALATPIESQYRHCHWSFSEFTKSDQFSSFKNQSNRQHMVLAALLPVRFNTVDMYDPYSALPKPIAKTEMLYFLRFSLPQK